MIDDRAKRGQPFGRRKFMQGALVLGGLSVAGVAATAVLARAPTGDLTADLENAPAGSFFTVPKGVWRVSRPITVKAPVRFAGGVIRPDPGVTVNFLRNVEAPSGTQIFDLDNIGWRRLEARRATRITFAVWETVGGVRLPDRAYATWFGATHGSDEDSSLAIQAMLDSGAREAILDGFFTHVANWVNDGQTLKGLAAHGGNRQYGLRTMVEEKPFSSLVGKANPTSPAQEPFRGISTKSGAGAVAFTDFEYDGSADRHFDHRDQYRSYGLDGTGRGERFWRRSIRATGISFGMDEDAEEQSTYISPQQTLIERVYVHNVVRNCILANRAPSVVIRDCRLANCDLDHLIYADRNPDLLVENTAFSGYALDALIVISSGTLRNCTVGNLTPNPIPGLETGSIVSIRADLEQPSVIENFNVTGDLGALGRGASNRELFRFSGMRNAHLRNIRITHQGSPDAVFSAFGAKANAGGITIEDVECDNMPPRARIWGTDRKIAGLSISNLNWSAAAGTDSAEPLLEFGELDGAVIKGVSVQGSKSRGFVEGRARIRNVEIDDLRYPGAVAEAQVVKAPAAANVRYQRRKIY